VKGSLGVYYGLVGESACLYWLVKSGLPVCVLLLNIVEFFIRVILLGRKLSLIIVFSCIILQVHDYSGVRLV
jgi:hypothetical protein